MTIEERLRKLEREMVEVKQAVAKNGKSWIATISGSFKGDPDFGEILRLGQEIRRADSSEDEDGNT
jgi:hypothetical protein